MLFSSDGNNILISKIDIFEPTCNVLIIIATKTAEVNRKYKSLICLAAESSYISPVWSTLQETGNEVINIFILCFPIAHNTLCLPPKFSINYFFFSNSLGRTAHSQNQKFAKFGGKQSPLWAIGK